MITESPSIRLHVEADVHEDVISDTIAQGIELPGLQTLVDLFPAITGWEIDRVRNQNTGTKIPEFTNSASTSNSTLLTHASQEMTDTALDRPEIEFGIVDMWSDWPDGRHCANRQQCDSVIGVFNQLIQQVHSTQRQLELLNAQLATSIPLATSHDAAAILLARLESVLKEGLKVLNVTAGGLYLLDDATRELHLRVQVGLPAQSLLTPPRKLRDCIADLDALVGHPFAIPPSGSTNVGLSLHGGSQASSDLLLDVGSTTGEQLHLPNEQQPTWNIPEDFPAALCVPVASHSAPLGTLWFFSETERHFSENEISIAEIIGGRMASELERESAVREGATNRRMIRDFDRAKLWQQLQSPAQLPEIAGWEVRANQFFEQGIGGAILDYSISPSGEIVTAIGDIQGAVFESSLAASSMRGAIRALEPSNLDSARLLFEVNNTMWNCPLGDQIGSLFLMSLDPATGIANWSNAGETGALILGRGCETEIAIPSSPLGACPDEEFESRSRVILPDSTLFVFNSGFRRLFRYNFRKSSDEEILEQLQQSKVLRPEEIQTWIEELVADFDSYRATPDVCFAAIHRTADDTASV